MLLSQLADVRPVKQEWPQSPALQPSESPPAEQTLPSRPHLTLLLGQLPKLTQIMRSSETSRSNKGGLLKASLKYRLSGPSPEAGNSVHVG